MALKNLHVGFLVILAGLLVLSVGAIQTYFWGTEGQVSLREGDSCDDVLVTSRSVVTATYLADGGQVSTDLLFAPGPMNWPDAKSLDFGQDDGLGIKIVKFIRHARERVDWVADASDYDGPALELRLCGPGGGWVDEDWLAASLFGGEAVIGPTLYQLWPLPVATMVEDFLHPPSEPESTSVTLSMHHEQAATLAKLRLPPSRKRRNLSMHPEKVATVASRWADQENVLGTLSMHYAGQMHRMPVDGNVGQRVPLGDTGIDVEIVDCFLDAKPKQEGGFFSRGNQPRNPLLELKIYFPDRAEPVRQIAFAKSPLVNLDGVHGSICPVRFWYHHPQLQRTPGAVFAQTPDGKLWCRPVVDGEYRQAEPVEAGSQVPIGGRFSIHVLKHIPQARREVSFTAAERPKEDGVESESAVLVEVTVAGTRREVWLQREDPRYATQTLPTEAGPLMLSFGYQRVPLGYQVHLDDFVRKSTPGEAEDTGFISLVRLTDPATRIEVKHEISVHRPLTHGKFTLHQTSVQQSTHGVETSTLRAVHDPGRLLKYLGCLTICAGIAIVVLMRAFYDPLALTWGESDSVRTLPSAR